MSTTLSMISRQLVLHDGGVPVPVGPLVAGGALDARDRDFRRRWVALGVVPDEQHAVLFQRGPGCGAGQPGRAPRVRHLLASAVAAPAPVVERACDLVALDFALREVTAHVAAVAVEHVDLAVTAAEDDQLLAEGVDRVRLAVTEISDQTQAMPAAGEPRRRGLRFDKPDFVGVRLRRHRHDSTPAARRVEATCSADQDDSSCVRDAAAYCSQSDRARARRFLLDFPWPTPQSTCWWWARAPAWPRRWPPMNSGCRC